MTGKQLKNSILQWAIQGKLVPQDPNDEPASVLLEKIRAEKARLVKEGKIKKDKKESIIYRGDDNSHYEKILATGEVKCIDDEIPFEVPDTWAWSRMNLIIQLLSGRDLEPSQYNSEGKGHPYMTGASNFNNRALIVNRWTETPVTISHKGDLLITCKGTVGAMAINNVGDIHIARQIMNISPWGIKLEYIQQFLEMYVIELQKAAKSIIPGISREDMLFALVPIPPLPEQHRIVDKLQELLPIVEQYDSAQSKLDSLNKDIKPALRKSILQEAIQGKLVPQDPNDEPASILLQRIKEEKLKLVEEGKLKKKDIVDSVIFKGDDNRYFEKIGKEVTCIDEDIPFEIPNGWVWCRIGQIAEFVNGLAFKPSEWENKGLPIIRIQNLTDNNRPYNYTTKIFEDKYKIRKDDLLFSWSATLDSFIWEGEDAWLNQHIFKVIPYKCIDKRFLYYSFKVLVYSFSNITHGLTMKHLTRGVFENHLFALPPLKEQKRIVAKIDEALAGIMSR